MAEKNVTLKDLLQYEPETYLSEEEVAWIRSTFKGNNKAIHILRKCFMPTAVDLPIEQLMEDLWFKGGFDPASVPDEHLKPLIVARQDVIKFVMGGLINLKQIANMPVESPLNAQLRKEKDSTK